MRIVAIVQARMGSTRLPGKVLRRLCGRSVLGHVVSRIQRSSRLDDLVVATTNNPDDDAIAAECDLLKIPSFRGSESDVLSRYSRAAKKCAAQAVVRITADCPLFDGMILDEMLSLFLEINRDGTTIDYLSNVQQRTFPRGLDAEVFTFEALARADREAKTDSEREHVTPYLYQHPEKFRLRSFENSENLAAHRWTLDTPEDWQFISAIYETLGADFTTQDVLRLLADRPELVQLNGRVEQKRL